MAVTWFDGVDILVEIAFDAGPLDAYMLDEFGEIMLDEDDLPIDIEWTDVSSYVRGIDISRGGSDEFSKFGPGTLNVTLSNRDRRFDPEYSSGPYFGKLNPMKKIRVKATYSSTTYDLFTGFVQGWPQQYEFTFDSTVTVAAVDGSRMLESSALSRSAYEAAVQVPLAPMYFWSLQESSPTSNTEFTDTVDDATITQQTVAVDSDPTQPVTAEQTAPLGGLQAVAPGTTAITVSSVPSRQGNFATGTYISADPFGLSFWCYASAGSAWTVLTESSPTGGNRNLITVSRLSDATMSATYLNAGLGKQGLLTGAQLTDGLHHICVYADTTTAYLYVDGVQSTSAALTNTTSAGGGGLGLYLYTLTPTAQSLDSYFSNVAVYPSGLTSAQVQAQYAAGVSGYGHPYGERTGARVGRVLDDVGWPSTDRTLSTGDTVHGPYIPDRQSAMAYIQDAETAEDGHLFIGADGYVVLRDRTWQWTQASAGTFSDDGADIPYEAITIDANSLEPLRTAVSVTYGVNDAYIKVEDTTAKADYGPALESLSTPTLQSSLTARSLAEYRLRSWKDPSTRIVDLTVQPRAKPATAYPVILGLELGDRITVERTPGNPVVGSQIVKSVTIRGLEHSITVDGVWSTTLYLSPAPELATAVPYLIVGDATYGQIGATAGNQIPF